MSFVPIQTDKSKDLEKWFIYPDSLENERFRGFCNRENESQLRGAFVVGQNVTFGGTSLPALRKGYEVIGAEAADSTPVKRAHVFENRAGRQFELKVAGTTLYSWIVGVSTSWAALKTGLTANTEWGFANIGRTIDNCTHCLFSNGVDGFFKFNGAYATFDSASNASGAVGTVSFTKNGVPSGVSIASAGAGYVAGDVVVLQGGDYQCQVRIDTVTSVGGAATISINSLSPGSGYAATTYQASGGHGGTLHGYTPLTITVTGVSTSGGTGFTLGDVLTITGGGGNAQLTVTGVSAGVVTSVSITAPGSGYSTGSGVACTGGTGTGFTINVDAVGNGWIKKQGTTTWEDEGFYTSGTNTINVNGTEYTVTGSGKSVFMVGVTPNPLTAGHAAGDPILQVPVVDLNLTGVQGSVMMSHDSRLHVRQESKKSVWDYSMLDDPFNFIATPASDGIGGAKDVEFGGPITAFGKLNKTVLCFKKRQIKMLDFIQVGSRVDSPRYQSLVPADDKGTTLGAMNQKSTFSTPLGQVFMTPDKRLALLSGVTANNEPQYVFLSDPCQPVFDQGVFDEASGICVDNVIYLAFKQDQDSATNDTVIRGDMTRQSIDSMGRVLPIRWDAPYIGWNVSDWTVIYDETTGENVIHWHSSLNSSSYRLIDQKSDGGSGYTATIRTWNEHFGYPQHQKKLEECFVEIKMNENTEVLATILYDEDGFTGRTEVTLDADSATYKYGGTEYNPFGASPFGSVKMGSNMASDNPAVYRFNIEMNNNIYFFNVSLQLSVDGDGQDFELVRFGYKLTEVATETDRKLLIRGA